MELVGALLNKEIHFITAPWNQLLEMLDSGELDIIPYIAEAETRQKYIDFTQFKHITHTTGLAVRKNEHINSMHDLSGRTVAVANWTFLWEHLKTHYPDINLLVAKTVSKALEAVSQDKAFAVAASLPQLNYLLQKEWLSNLKTVSVEDLDISKKTEPPMGVAKGQVLLKSILEKAHPAGDRLLKEISRTLANNIRKVDTAGKWGGEEFLLIRPFTMQRKAVVTGLLLPLMESCLNSSH